MRQSKKYSVLIVVAGVILLFVAGLTTFLYLKSQEKPPEDDPKPSSTITTSKVASGFSAPTAIVSTPNPDDQRLFVVERAGTVKTLTPGNSNEPEEFMNIQNKVFAEEEMGFLGLAFHPDYQENGYLFVNYINKDQQTVVARFYSEPGSNTVDLNSEKTILTFNQPHNNHNGGDMAFGPDGYLYIASGDGGRAGDPDNLAQNLSSYHGKILRIDINTDEPYIVPPTNPFVNDSSARSEIWAYGLRNPWRISFDAGTGDLYMADVGQGNIEEIDFQPASSTGGENYGWRCYEGTAEYNIEGCGDASDYTAPIVEYDHSDGRCSVTGGYVYRGEQYPSLEGKYIYGDFCSGHIFYAERENDKWTQSVAAETPYMISAFGQASDKELYFTDFQTGDLYKIEAAPNS